MAPTPKTTIADAAEAIRRITGNPSCKRSGCHGRGYVSITLDQDCSAKVNLCECGRIGRSDYNVLQERLDAIERNFEEMSTMVFRHTLFGGLKVVWRKFMKGPGLKRPTA